MKTRELGRSASDQVSAAEPTRPMACESDKRSETVVGVRELGAEEAVQPKVYSTLRNYGKALRFDTGQWLV